MLTEKDGPCSALPAALEGITERLLFLEQKRTNSHSVTLIHPLLPQTVAILEEA